MAHLQIKSYGLSDTTLEEIFLKVASNIHDGEIVREIQYEDITDHGRLVDHLFFSSLKFSFSEKTTKFYGICLMVLTFT